MARLTACLLVFVACAALACAGAGAAIDAGQDGVAAGAGGAVGAGVGVATGGSALLVAGLAFIGSFITSLWDQAAEGAISASDAAPYGIIQALWAYAIVLIPLAALALFLFWCLPGPFKMARGIVVAALRALGRAVRAARHHMGSQLDFTDGPKEGPSRDAGRPISGPGGDRA